MPIFMLKPETTKQLASLMESWVFYARDWRGDNTLFADHAAIYLSGAAAALDQIHYQNDFPKIEFRNAIDDVVRDLRERGDEALEEWLKRLDITPQNIAKAKRPFSQ